MEAVSVWYFVSQIMNPLVGHVYVEQRTLYFLKVSFKDLINGKKWKVPAPMLKQRKLKRKWLKTPTTCGNGVTLKFPRLIGVD